MIMHDKIYSLGHIHISLYIKYLWVDLIAFVATRKSITGLRCIITNIAITSVSEEALSFITKHYVPEEINNVKQYNTNVIKKQNP